ncbi:hypothetical protein ACFL2Q_09740 [Thermodesulfobacteriota bacterium]
MPSSGRLRKLILGGILLILFFVCFPIPEAVAANKLLKAPFYRIYYPPALKWLAFGMPKWQAFHAARGVNKSWGTTPKHENNIIKSAMTNRIPVYIVPKNYKLNERSAAYARTTGRIYLYVSRLLMINYKPDMKTNAAAKWYHDKEVGGLLAHETSHWFFWRTIQKGGPSQHLKYWNKLGPLDKTLVTAINEGIAFYKIYVDYWYGPKYTRSQVSKSLGKGKPLSWFEVAVRYNKEKNTTPLTRFSMIAIGYYLHHSIYSYNYQMLWVGMRHAFTNLPAPYTYNLTCYKYSDQAYWSWHWRPWDSDKEDSQWSKQITEDRVVDWAFNRHRTLIGLDIIPLDGRGQVPVRFDGTVPEGGTEATTYLRYLGYLGYITQPR